MCLTFEETTKKPPYKTTCSCKTINGTKSVITQNIPENVINWGDFFTTLHKTCIFFNSIVKPPRITSLEDKNSTCM